MIFTLELNQHWADCRTMTPLGLNSMYSIFNLQTVPSIRNKLMVYF